MAKKPTKTDKVTALITKGPGGESPAPAPAPVQDGPRTIEAVTAEILALKAKAGEALIEIGRRLIEAKEMLPHGEWLPWLEGQVDFSERTAQNLMRIAREWTNPQALADLGASKAIRLLSLPEAEREEFIQAAHTVNGAEKSVAEMSTRELEQAIKERDEARKNAAEVEEKLKSATSAANERAEELLHAKEKIRELEKKPVEVAVQPVPDEQAIREAVERAESALKARLETVNAEKLKAAEAGKTEAEDKAEALATALGDRDAEIKKLQAELSAAKKSASKNADLPEDKILYKILCENIQGDANKLAGIALKAKQAGDTQLAAGVKKALEALAGMLHKLAEREEDTHE